MLAIVPSLVQQYCKKVGKSSLLLSDTLPAARAVPSIDRVSTNISIHLSIFLLRRSSTSTFPSIYLSVCPSIYRTASKKAKKHCACPYTHPNTSTALPAENTNTNKVTFFPFKEIDPSTDRWTNGSTRPTHLQDPCHRTHGELLEHVVGPVRGARQTGRHGKLAGVALRLAPAPPRSDKRQAIRPTQQKTRHVL